MLRNSSRYDDCADLSKIKHVVYLMMENHSFDNIAGYWDFHPDIDNLRNISYCNEYTNPNCMSINPKQQRLTVLTIP